MAIPNWYQTIGLILTYGEFHFLNAHKGSYGKALLSLSSSSTYVLAPFPGFSAQQNVEYLPYQTWRPVEDLKTELICQCARNYNSTQQHRPSSGLLWCWKSVNKATEVRIVKRSQRCCLSHCSAHSRRLIRLEPGMKGEREKKSSTTCRWSYLWGWQVPVWENPLERLVCTLQRM